MGTAHVCPFSGLLHMGRLFARDFRTMARHSDFRPEYNIKNEGNMTACWSWGYLRRAKSFLFLAAIGVVLCALAVSSKVSAQALYGSLVGVVTDPSGAVVPGVKVAAKNVGTGQIME